MVEIAEKAKRYGEATLGGRLFHCAVFGREKEQASAAVMVIENVKDWKGTQIFVGGRPLDRFYNVESTVKCYLNSTDAIDRNAYCNFIYTDVADESSLFEWVRNGKYLVPCRQLQGFVREVVRHPIGTPEADIQAAAIRRGCFWCPNFEAKTFRHIKGREVLRLGNPAFFKLLLQRKK